MLENVKAQPGLVCVCTSFLFWCTLTRPDGHKWATSAGLENTYEREAGYDRYTQDRK